MKVSKGLKEVWEWKEAVYKETKDMDKKTVIRYIHKSVDRFLERMDYKKEAISEKIYRLNKNEEREEEKDESR